MARAQYPTVKDWNTKSGINRGGRIYCHTLKSQYVNKVMGYEYPVYKQHYIRQSRTFQIKVLTITPWGDVWYHFQNEE